MKVSRLVLGALALSVTTGAVLPVLADTVVEKTYYRTSYAPVTKKTTVYKTAYVPVTRRRVVYEKTMVPVRKKVSCYHTAYVPVRHSSVVRTAYASPDTTEIERKTVTRTTRTTAFIPTTVIAEPTTIVRTSELMPSSVVMPDPLVTSTTAIVPEPGTVVYKEKHHKVKVSTLEPVYWY